MSEFDRIIGYTAVKRELARISDVLKHTELYAQLGVTPPAGLLLNGEPGVGKTLMAQCLIEAVGRTVFTCRKNEPDGKFVETIKNTFDSAAQNAPSIVFLDDMDKFANEDIDCKDAEEYVTVQSCIDEVKGKGVFVLATANDLFCMPDSLLRPGRFDRIIEIETPEGDDAVAIVSHFMKSKPFVADIDPKLAARLMNRRSCAELEAAINEAGMYAGFERSEVITEAHFLRACMKQIFGVPEDAFSREIDSSGSIPRQIAWHEAGHAVIHEVLNPGSVTMMALYKSGSRYRGFTASADMEERCPNERQQAEIIAALGGMAAVEQCFCVSDSGCSHDLECAFGMTEDLVKNHCVAGFHLYSSGRDSEALQYKQEETVAHEVERYYRKAKEILSLNTEFLNALAEAMLEKKTLSMLDVERIKAACPLTAVSV